MMRMLLRALLVLTFVGSVAQAQSPQRCYLGAFTADRDGKATKVRSGPGEGYRPIAVLPVDRDGVIVRIDRCEGPWLRIYNATTVGGQWIFGGHGWVHASRLATHTRYAVNLYARPDKTADVRARVPAEALVQLLGANGKWAKVQYQTTAGWLEPEAQCPNPVTTCP